jgi:hypothetical protein
MVAMSSRRSPIIGSGLRSVGVHASRSSPLVGFSFQLSATYPAKVVVFLGPTHSSVVVLTLRLIFKSV